MRVCPLPCRGGFLARQEFGFVKTVVASILQEYIHSCKMLVGVRSLPPGKGPLLAVLSSLLTGRLRVLRTLLTQEDNLSQPVKLPLFSARKGAWPLHLWNVRNASGPCRGIGGAPNKRFEPFSQSGKWANAQRCVPLCPACQY